MPEPKCRDSWKTERELFAKKMEGWVNDPEIELWFSDECGVEGDPRPRRRWVEPGLKPTIPYSGSHLRRNVIGAVRPVDGALSALIFSHCNTAVFQIFLDTFAQEYSAEPGKRQILVMDNGSWHKTKSLNWHHFEPEYLPPYSPDFNPIERLWFRLKNDFFSDYFYKKGKELEGRIIEGLQELMSQPEVIASQCRFSENF